MLDRGTAVQVVEGAAEFEPPGMQLDLSSILSTLRKQRPLIAAAVAACLLLAISYLVTATPRYTATTRILIDARKTPLFQNTRVIEDQTLDAGVVDSQVEILKSESVALTAVRQLHLDSDGEFTPSGGVISSLMSLISGNGNGDGGGGAEDHKHDAERAAANTLLANLIVKRVGLTYVIEVGVRALSPAKASAAANAVADAYMVGELEAKYEATKRASRWLQDRIAELRQEASDADKNVQKYKASNNIIDTSRGLISEQQLADVNSQLVLARAATAEAKARYDRIAKIVVNDDVPDGAVSDALHNDVITRLRAQYLDLANREADITARYGVNHQASINLRNQMREIKRSIGSEMNRIAQTTKSDFEIAQAREQSLQGSLGKLVNENGEGGVARVHLRDLESTAQSYRNLYDSFLQKFMEATQQQTFPITEARVITRATPPSGKSWPKPFMVLGGAGVFGALVGFALAFAREMLNQSFRSIADVQRFTGFECLGILPSVDDATVGPGRGGQRQPACRQVLGAPFSRFSETVRNIKVSVDLSRLTRDMTVIGIASSLPREGKTTVVANLAQLAASGGHKTLIIDADLRNPNLTKLMAPTAEVGLIEVLARSRALADAVVVDPDTNLHMLPAVVPVRMANAAELLGSENMRELLEVARNSYEYVFVDFAPAGPVVDAKAAAHLVDCFVMIVEWGETSRQVVNETLNGNLPLRERLIGIVLNRADPAVLKRHEAYLGSSYHRYYVDGGSPA